MWLKNTCQEPTVGQALHLAKTGLGPWGICITSLGRHQCKADNFKRLKKKGNIKWLIYWVDSVTVIQVREDHFPE